MSIFFAQLITLLVGPPPTSPAPPTSVQHVLVSYEDGRFAGWPANHGIWSWGDEILVGFSRGTYKDQGSSHHIDREKPEEFLLARSKDGGLSWKVEQPQPTGALVGAAGMRHGIVPPGPHEPAPVEFTGKINFTHPDFAMTLRMEGSSGGASRYSLSYDRGKTWLGPYRLPLFGRKGIMARTDMIVNGPGDCTVMLTAEKSTGGEGRPICVRTTDHGRTWQFQSDVGPEPAGYSIMPSTVRISPTELVTTIRSRLAKKSWIDAFASHDDGRSWSLLSTPEPDAGEGNPPSLLRLKDGRLSLIYGYRAQPFGIRARLSEDDGKTWTPPIILRNDGGGRDVGYVRSVQRPDGKIVAIYYYHAGKNPTRFLGATIWDPSR